jgi:MFS family permease
VIPPLLRENANFRRYFFGQAVSLIGDQISLVAIPLTAVLALHATPGQMGALTTVALVPNLIFSLHAGSWIDRRGDRRGVMLLTDVGRGLLVATIPIAYALGHLTWWHLYVVAFGTGTLSVFFYVAYGGFFQTIVRREDYVSANSLTHGTRAFSFFAGASLGGVLVQVLRGPYALVVDAVSFIWSAAFLRRIDAPDPPAGADGGGVLAGARWIRGNGIIRAELVGVATLNLFNFVFFALYLLYVTRTLGVRPATVGVILGSASVGALAGSAVAGRLARRFGVGPTFLAGCFLFPAPLVLIPAASGPHWLVVVFLLAAETVSGFGLMLLDILAGAIMAGVIPASLRSRVSGAFALVNNGVRPIGTALGGALGTWIGVRTTLWIGTVGALAGLLFLVPSPIRSLHDVPDEGAL